MALPGSAASERHLGFDRGITARIDDLAAVNSNDFVTDIIGVFVLKYQ